MMQVNKDSLAEIGRTIRAERKKINLTQTELAQKAGVTRGTVANLELGVIENPTLLVLTSVFDVIGMKLMFTVISGSGSAISIQEAPIKEVSKKSEGIPLNSYKTQEIEGVNTSNEIEINKPQQILRKWK